MIKSSDQQNVKFPAWLIIGSILFTILGLSVLAAIEIDGTYNQSWLSLLLIALLYIPIQIIVEGVLSVFWESKKWVTKLIPIIILACFYAVIFLFK